MNDRETVMFLRNEYMHHVHVSRGVFGNVCCETLNERCDGFGHRGCMYGGIPYLETVDGERWPTCNCPILAALKAEGR